MQKITQTELPWETLQQVRGWSRVRANLPALRAERRVRSACLFCGAEVRSAEEYGHVFDHCAAWAEHRAAVMQAAARQVSPPWSQRTPLMLVLLASPEDAHFFVATRFAAEVDRAATGFAGNRQRESGQGTAWPRS